MCFSPHLLVAFSVQLVSESKPPSLNIPGHHFLAMLLERNIPFLKKLWPRQLIVAVRGLFSSCGEWGLLSRCGCVGFLLRWRLLLWWLLLLWRTGLVAPYHVESSQTGDRTHVPSFGKQILNHWTIRKILYSFKCVCYCVH